MKSIKEKAEDLYPDKKVVLARGNTCLSCGRVKRESFETGANYVLGEIENFMKGLDIGNSAEEKFCKLDVLADIHRFIQQLNEK